LAATPWVVSKVMRDIVLYWRRGGLSVLPYLDDFPFTKRGKHACWLLIRRVSKDFFDAGLIINEAKCELEQVLCLRQLGYDLDLGERKFRVPVDRWNGL